MPDHYFDEVIKALGHAGGAAIFGQEAGSNLSNGWGTSRRAGQHHDGHRGLTDAQIIARSEILRRTP
jgi:hypothetical protein